ncbi:MAG: RpnC/YadD family protein [Isosphaeraceae bacterium]
MAKPKRGRGASGRRQRHVRGPDYDSPWKDALDRFFERCLAFFFPRIHADIDWTRGYEMLDKELQPIIRRAEHGRRYVDKLVKVWLRTGEQKWILIHIEVQASKEAAFPERIYVYNHRLFDRYGREVVSLAILADDDPDWKPNRYEYARWDFHTSIQFPVVKLLDYAPRYQELETDPNPFAVVVLAHLKALETRRSPEERRGWKVRLVKGLYGRGLTPEDVHQLFAFIDWVMELPQSLEEHFWDEIDAYEQETSMPFVSIAERMTLVKGMLRGIEVALDVKFDTAGLELMPELRQIRDPELLGKVLAKIKTAETPDDLRRIWTRKRRSKPGRSE